MGIFQSLLKNVDPEPFNFTVNFKAQPSAKEEIHAKCLEITTNFTKIIEGLNEYKGCTDSIRAAISSPSKENDEKCWGEILPAVSRIKDLYDFTQKLGKHTQNSFIFIFFYVYICALYFIYAYTEQNLLFRASVSPGDRSTM
jgi:hypothetical protein